MAQWKKHTAPSFHCSADEKLILLLKFRPAVPNKHQYGTMNSSCLQVSLVEYCWAAINQRVISAATFSCLIIFEVIIVYTSFQLAYPSCKTNSSLLISGFSPPRLHPFHNPGTDRGSITSERASKSAKILSETRMSNWKKSFSKVKGIIKVFLEVFSVYIYIN